MDTTSQVEIPPWCTSLKKVELHAHLSGSVSPSTIRKLLNKPCNAHIREKAKHLLDCETGRTLKQCFDLFPIIHELIDDATTLQMVVKEVLQDFQNDNVVYLELRTTPRETPRMTEFDYLQTVLRTVAEFHEQRSGPLVCRLLVSVSRHLPVDAAWRAVQITERVLQHEPEHISRLIVGFELSGNPEKGLWPDFRPVFQHVREKHGFPVSLHFAEIDNEEECVEMLNFRPDRVGHAIIMSEKVTHQLINQRPKIGVEVCITSNLMTKAAVSVQKHPVVTHLIPTGHPFCICTDDSGVFDTTLSKEFALLDNTIQLSQKDAKSYVLQGLELAFCKEKGVIDAIRDEVVA